MHLNINQTLYTSNLAVWMEKEGRKLEQSWVSAIESCSRQLKFKTNQVGRGRGKGNLKINGKLRNSFKAIATLIMIMVN